MVNTIETRNRDSSAPCLGNINTFKVTTATAGYFYTGTGNINYTNTHSGLIGQHLIQEKGVQINISFAVHKENKMHSLSIKMMLSLKSINAK